MRNLISLLFPILLIIFILFTMNRCGRKYSEQVDKGAAYVGERVVIDGDTLTITNFKVFRDEFVLSNGTTIFVKSLDNFLIKD